MAKTRPIGLCLIGQFFDSILQSTLPRALTLSAPTIVTSYKHHTSELMDDGNITYLRSRDSLHLAISEEVPLWLVPSDPGIEWAWPVKIFRQQATQSKTSTVFAWRHSRVAAWRNSCTPIHLYRRANRGWSRYRDRKVIFSHLRLRLVYPY